MSTLTPIYDDLIKKYAVKPGRPTSHAATESHLETTAEWKPDWTLVPAAVHGQEQGGQP